MNTAQIRNETETDHISWRKLLIALTCCLVLLVISLYLFGFQHWLSLLAMSAAIALIVLVPIYELAQTYLSKKLSENDWHFLNMTWVTRKEIRILTKTDLEDFEQVIASFGKNLLPWEKRFLVWAGESLRNKLVTRVICIAIGVSIGLVIGNATIWIVSIF